ncbi:MAG: hypothetical protein M0Z28_30000 [Rhodospirillales bacterium]|nr:hypothetical protein [Rhodospirillales bacterium]
MFRVQTPVVVVFSTEAQAALDAQQRAAGLAAWRALAGLGQGLEMAHFQIVFAGVTLAVSSRLRKDGFIVIELGLGDPRQAARVIPAAQLRQAEARARSRHALASHAR